MQRPDAAAPGLRRALLVVNGRPFREPSLLRAADRAYRTTVPPGARPWLFLELALPPGAVDVNVHPAKAEVRFRDATAIEVAVETGVKEALTRVSSAATLDRVPERPRLVARERPPDAQTALFVPAPAPGASPDEEAEGPALAAERSRLFQLHHTYILAETREGLFVIDQHSAHERVLFERLMTAFAGGWPARATSPVPPHAAPATRRIPARGGTPGDARARWFRGGRLRRGYGDRARRPRPPSVVRRGTLFPGDGWRS